MSTWHSPITARELVRLLEKLGFSLVRQKGSHAFFCHPDGRRTTVPIHSGDLSPYVVREIFKQINVSDSDEEIKLQFSNTNTKSRRHV